MIRRALSTAAILTACASPPHASRVSAPAAVASSTPAAEARALADGIPFFLPPTDADPIAIDLLPARSGTSHLYVVPALSAADYRGGTNMHRAFTLLDAKAAPLTRGAPPTTGRPLPVPHPPTAKVAPPSPPTDVTSTPPATRAFKIYEPSSRSYVAASGRRAYLGATYAFYEDTVNTINFTQAEYARIDATLEAWWPRLRAVFGGVTDLDRDGHVLVFLTSTAATVRPNEGQSFVDACDLNGLAACGATGEVIYFFALDAFADAKSKREDYVTRFYPRNILHETVHLAQMRAAIDAAAPLARIVVPPFYQEGQATVVSLLTKLGEDEAWNRARPLLTRNGTNDTPFSHPYTLGALFFFWMHQAFGAWVERPIMTELFNIAAVDPIERAAGVPEPLAIAEMAASLDLDGTPYGATNHLEFPGAHVAERLGAPPASATLSIGSTLVAEIGYTGHASIAIAHDEPVRVTLHAAGTRPYVLVVQP